MGSVEKNTFTYIQDLTLSNIYIEVIKESLEIKIFNAKVKVLIKFRLYAKVFILYHKMKRIRHKPFV